MRRTTKKRPGIGWYRIIILLTGAPSGGRLTQMGKSPAEVYLSKWALDSIARVLSDGAHDHSTYPWQELRYESTRSIAAELSDEEEYAPATINKCLSSLRGVLKAVWMTGAMPDDAYSKIEIKNVANHALAAGHVLKPAHQEALKTALGLVGVRDAAIIAVMRACGLRRVEVVRLKKESYDGEAVRAYGKGNKPREVPVGDTWRQWLDSHWRTLAKGAFAFVDTNGVQLTRRSIAYIVEKFCVSAGIDPVFTPHDLRRSFATELLDAGVDIGTVAELMGHNSLDTTSIYDRRGDARKRAAVQAIR
jgi:site-specific recombinase XerD